MTAFKNSSLRDVTPGSRAYFRIFASFFGTRVIDNVNGNNLGRVNPISQGDNRQKEAPKQTFAFCSAFVGKEPIFQTNHIAKNKEKK